MPGVQPVIDGTPINLLTLILALYVRLKSIKRCENIIRNHSVTPKIFRDLVVRPPVCLVLLLQEPMTNHHSNRSRRLGRGPILPRYFSPTAARAPRRRERQPTPRWLRAHCVERDDAPIAAPRTAVRNIHVSHALRCQWWELVGEGCASPPYRRRLNGLCNSRLCRPRLRPLAAPVHVQLYIHSRVSTAAAAPEPPSRRRNFLSGIIESHPWRRHHRRRPPTWS